MSIVTVAQRKCVYSCGNILLLTASLTACGMFGGDYDLAYKNAETLAPLTIPDGLVAPSQRAAIRVPESITVPQQWAGLDISELEIPPEFITRQEQAAETTIAKADQNSPEQQQDAVGISAEIVRHPDERETLIASANMDSVWPQVGKALKVAGFAIEDDNRGKGIYSVYRDIDKLKIDDPLKPLEVEKREKESYLVYVEEYQGKLSELEISVRDMKGRLDGSALAKHLLVQIKNILENP